MGHQLCKVQKALGGLLLFQARQWYYHVMDSKKAPSAQSAWTPEVGREKDKCINNKINVIIILNVTIIILNVIIIILNVIIIIMQSVLIIMLSELIIILSELIIIIILQIFH